MARQRDVPQAMQRMAKRIEHTSARAERMLHDLLDFTQVRRDRLQVHSRPFDVNAQVQVIIEDARLLHPDRDVALADCEFGDVMADPDRVAQAIGNLVGKALHYSPPETPVAVTFVRAGDDGLCIRVHNYGEPIDPALLPRLFLPLERGPTHVQAMRATWASASTSSTR